MAERQPIEKTLGHNGVMHRWVREYVFDGQSPSCSLAKPLSPSSPSETTDG